MNDSARDQPTQRAGPFSGRFTVASQASTTLAFKMYRLLCAPESPQNGVLASGFVPPPYREVLENEIIEDYRKNYAVVSKVTGYHRTLVRCVPVEYLVTLLLVF